jgi:hypothetical protein
MVSTRLLLIATALSLALGMSVARAQDEIRYADRTTHKDVTAAGTIQDESPSRIVYKPGAGSGTKEIPALDVIDVTYELAGTLKQAYRRALADDKRTTDPSAKDEDRQKGMSEALKEYQDLLPNLGGEKLKAIRRQVQYKIARLLARQADDDPGQVDAAIEALQRFKKDYADGWQISTAARLLAHLQLLKGETDGAQKTYQELAAIPGIPPEVRDECELQAADALILGKKIPEAEAKLQDLLKSSGADSTQQSRIRIYLALCQGASGKVVEATTQLEAIIAQTNDNSLKAVAYNALGDCYRLANRQKEALWPYLWVDVIYHQDRQEHIKAMGQLARLFDDLGDKAKAKQYRDRLKKEAK